MTDKLKQTIKDEVAKLPKKIQEAINSLDWVDIAEEIGKKFLLMEGEINDLQVETLLVLVGIEDFDLYANNIENNIGTSKEEAEKIAEEANQKIFTPISNALPENINSETSEKTNIEQKLDNRFEKLPKEIKNIFNESNYQEILYNIAKEYNLNVMQMGILEKIVTDLIIGAIHSNDFRDIVEDSINLPSEKITELVNNINEKIFKTIRGKMMALPNTQLKIPKTPTQIKNTETQIQKSDTDILKSHGIEIVPEKLELNSGENASTPSSTFPKGESAPSFGEGLGEVKKEEPHPILAQKMSGSFQIPTVKTEHTDSGNLSKPATPVSILKTYPKGTDPYRMTPE